MPMLLSYLRELNLFQPKDNTVENEEDRRSNIIITRLYLIVLFCCLMGLALALKLNNHSTKLILHNPTINQFNTLPVDAQCPCSRLAFSYGDFITLQANFLQVCSSDFVSDRWIKTIFKTPNGSSFQKGDIRSTGSALFQALASLCYLSNKTVQDSLSSFYASSFISSQVLSQDVLEKTIDASIEQFQFTMPNIFISQFNLTNKMIFGNQLISGLQTDSSTVYVALFRTPATFWGPNVAYVGMNSEQCNCYNDYDCRIAMGVYPLLKEDSASGLYWYEASIIIKIPGLFIGCMPINSLLYSSLECFYNQTCINQIIPFLSTNYTFTAMTISEESVFKFNSTIQSIVDRTMVEKWTKNISYQQYYEQCAPRSCTYTKVEQYSSMFVLTKVIGLLGSLILVLTLFIPPVIRFIRKKRGMNENEPTPAVPWRTRLGQLKSLIKSVFVNLNIFTKKTRNNQHIHYQIVGTRVYIFILIVSFAVLVLYSSVTQELHRVTILNPTQSQYTELENAYSSSLICPCTTISIPHEIFIQLEPIYHQICSSYFVSPEWIAYLKSVLVLFTVQTFYPKIDLGAQFELLATLCKYANQTVDSARSTFLQTQFVSSQVVEQDIFDLEINSLIDNWKSNTINQFEQALQLIRATNQGNKLLNIFFNFQNVQVSSSAAIIRPLQYSNCWCDLFDSCRQPTPIGQFNFDTFTYDAIFTIDSFFTGCSPLEALLQSTLEFFYNQTCVNRMYTQLSTGFGAYENTAPNITVLNITNQWPNETTETIESIMNRLIINQWSSNVSFSSYYNACAPSSCIFEYQARRNIFLIALMIISVFGGLSTGLKIVTLIFVRLAEKLSQHNSRLAFKQLIKNLFACQNQQQTTNRIHFMVLIILLFVFYLFSFVPSQLITIQITKPSLPIYQDLSTHFSQSLQCSCSKNSFNYHTFLSIQPYYHPICSSHFMSNEWILYVYNKQNSFLQYNYTDFRRTSVGQFQLLQSLCQLSLSTVNISISQLEATLYIDSQLAPSNDLIERIKTVTDDFKINTPKSFLTTLDIIRQVTHANKLMSMYWSNWKYPDVGSSTSAIKISTEPQLYQECNCALSSECIQSSRNMMIGCYPLEALLQSTLQCFYDQQCIDSDGIFPALNSSFISNHFNLNQTIETILQELMVENYSIDVSYEKYFQECAASSCTYSYIGRENIIDVITTLIGLYGGLVIISAWLAKLIVKLYLYRKTKIAPQTQ